MPDDLNNIVLYEDNHIIIVNKPACIPVQEDKSLDQPLTDIVKNYIKKKYSKPGEVFLGVIHRLDRPVSGVVMFARTSKALVRLNEMMKNRQIRKIYWAVVKNKPPSDSDTLIHFLQRNETRNKSYVYDENKSGAVIAELKYDLIASAENYYLLEIELLTGRHHQIRAQLAAINCPIKGDLKYNFPRSNKDGSIHLHARRIELIHPVTKELICVEANPPDESLWNYFIHEIKNKKIPEK